MKIFVFAYDRFFCSTSVMLEQEWIPHMVLIHTEYHYKEFIRAGAVKPDRLVITGNPRGLAYQRNSALEMMEDGEWALFLVDDLKSITELRNYDRAMSPLPITFENQKAYADRFKNPISLAHFLERCEEFTKKLERNGAYLGGFAGIDNTAYRSKHYVANVVADGRAWLVRKSHLRFDEEVQLIDDVAWTALNMKEFGIVLVDQWILPDCERYTQGGFGSKEQRMEQRLAECAYLVANYPEYVAFRNKAGWPTGSHITIRQGKKPRIKR